MDWQFIFFLTMGIVNFFLIRPKRVLQEWGIFTIYTAWNWKEFFRTLFISTCYWFVGFYILLTLIYDYYAVNDDQLVFKENREYWLKLATLWGLVMILLVLFLRESVYNAIANSLLALAITHIIFPCEHNNSICYTKRALLLLLIFALFFVAFKYVSAPVRWVMVTLSEHLTISFTVMACILCISRGFERWQDEDMAYVPILAGAALAIPRGIYSWCYQYLTCCHRSEVVERMLDYMQV